MVKRMLLLIAAVISVVIPAHAVRDGRTMLSSCNYAVAEDDGQKLDEKGVIGNLSCRSYVGGYLDAFGIVLTVNKMTQTKQLFCPPQDLPVDGLMQTIRIFVKYMREHPEDLASGAGALLTLALQDAFPCPVKK